MLVFTRYKWSHLFLTALQRTCKCFSFMYVETEAQGQLHTGIQSLCPFHYTSFLGHIFTKRTTKMPTSVMQELIHILLFTHACTSLRTQPFLPPI